MGGVESIPLDLAKDLLVDGRPIVTERTGASLQPFTGTPTFPGDDLNIHFGAIWKSRALEELDDVAVDDAGMCLHVRPHRIGRTFFSSTRSIAGLWPNGSPPNGLAGRVASTRNRGRRGAGGRAGLNSLAREGAR